MSPDKIISDEYKRLAATLKTTTKEEVASSKKQLIAFVKANKPAFLEPYAFLWNIFASENGKALVVSMTPKRKSKIKIRVSEQGFDFISILAEAKKSVFLKSKSFFGFDWIIKNEENYVKILEGNYKNEPPPEGNSNGELSAAEQFKKNQNR